MTINNNGCGERSYVESGRDSRVPTANGWPVEDAIRKQQVCFSGLPEVYLGLTISKNKGRLEIYRKYKMSRKK